MPTILTGDEYFNSTYYNITGIFDHLARYHDWSENATDSRKAT